MATRVRRLSVILIAMVLVLSSLSLQTANAASGPGCFISLHGDLEVNQLVRFHEVIASVDSQCRIHITETKSSGVPTAGPRKAAVMASLLRGCRTENVMFDDLGGADLTRLSKSIEFYYDGGAAAVLNNHFASAYNAPGSPYTWGNLNDYASNWGPASEVQANASADYFWWWAYDHYKVIFAYGTYTGSCHSSYSHVGNVCSTCRVIARLTYYL